MFSLQSAQIFISDYKTYSLRIHNKVYSYELKPSNAVAYVKVSVTAPALCTMPETAVIAYCLSTGLHACLSSVQSVVFPDEALFKALGSAARKACCITAFL